MLLISNKQTMIMIVPNVEVDWLALLLHVWEVLCSNLGPNTSYPDCDFSWFSSAPAGKWQDSRPTLNYATTASFHILSFNAIQPELLTVALNKSYVCVQLGLSFGEFFCRVF
jgi:hypothetical protein